MKVIFSCAFLISVLTINAFSQQAVPSPTPSPAADNDVVKISTNLIQVDVTVTDAMGKVIRDLKPEDVEIYENGQKQKISHFSFISAAQQSSEASQAKDTKVAKDAIPVPTAKLRTDQIRRTVA